jgi:hypothetical protein
MDAYSFYKKKYDLKTLNLKITESKILFLIYDEKYNYYLDNGNFFTSGEKVNILKKIEELNKTYKLEITNFYPVCFCSKTLVIAFKTNNVNTNLMKVYNDKILLNYKFAPVREKKGFISWISKYR